MKRHRRMELRSGAAVDWTWVIAILRSQRSRAMALSAIVDEVRDALHVPLSKILEVDPSGRWLRVAAGNGWLPGIVGSARVPCRTASQAGLTIALGTPVVCDDLRSANGLCEATLLRRNGAVSGVTVPIGPSGQPWGVLSAHDVRYRVFTPEDVRVLVGIANALGSFVKPWPPPPPMAA